MNKILRAVIGSLLGCIAGLVLAYIAGLMGILPQIGKGMAYEKGMAWMEILGVVGLIVGLVVALKRRKLPPI